MDHAEVLKETYELLTKSTTSLEVARASAMIALATELRLSSGAPAAAPAASRPAAAAASRPAPSGTTGAVFPNYGRSKNAPVAGATVDDLEYYAAGCRRTLDDGTKERWHEKERVLLAAIEAELANQGAGGGGQSSGGQSRGSSAPPANDPPPHTDDDIPF